MLHGDERYQPCGWTAPLARTVDLKTFQNQTAKPKRLNEKLWHEMLRGKTLIPGSSNPRNLRFKGWSKAETHMRGIKLKKQRG